MPAPVGRDAYENVVVPAHVLVPRFQAHGITFRTNTATRTSLRRIDKPRRGDGLEVNACLGLRAPVALDFMRMACPPFLESRSIGRLSFNPLSPISSQHRNCA